METVFTINIPYLFLTMSTGIVRSFTTVPLPSNVSHENKTHFISALDAGLEMKNITPQHILCTLSIWWCCGILKISFPLDAHFFFWQAIILRRRHCNMSYMSSHCANAKFRKPCHDFSWARECCIKSTDCKPKCIVMLLIRTSFASQINCRCKCLNILVYLF